MNYIISDIHGCYDEYQQLLKKISFSDEDRLYILGDAVDRGSEPIKVLLDIMSRPNAVFILGNHDYIMSEALNRTNCDLDGANTDDDTSELIEMWLADGGETTFSQLRELSYEQRRAILEYVLDAELCVFKEVNGRNFVIVHSDLRGFKGDLESLDIADICMSRADYSRRYFKDVNTFLVTGHTPTPFIVNNKSPIACAEIYEENGHIAIDCGCVYGGRLAAYCLETGEKFYVSKAR